MIIDSWCDSERVSVITGRVEVMLAKRAGYHVSITRAQRGNAELGAFFLAEGFFLHIFERGLKHFSHLTTTTSNSTTTTTGIAQQPLKPSRTGR